MGYAESLEVLARLHVDPRFRETWMKDAAVALAPLPLAPAEREALTRVDPVVVDRAGRMMDYHRLARVREQLPWVDEARRPELAATLRGFLTDVLPELLNREEAMAFCHYVEAHPEGLPAYVPDVARCERLRIALAWTPHAPSAGAGAGPQVESFAFPVLEVLAALGGPGWPEVAPRPTRVEYLKVPGLPAVLVRGQAEAR